MYKHEGPKPDRGAFYNVERAVGPNQPNRPSDVKLVQYLLRHIYGNQAAALAIDGLFGFTTSIWIRKYQYDAKVRGVNVLIDGLIDRALGEVSSISKTVYAIIAMNWDLKKKDPAAYARLPSVIPPSTAPLGMPPPPGGGSGGKIVVSYTPWRWKPPQGWESTVTYSDGSKATVYCRNLRVDGQAYHGKVVSVTVGHTPTLTIVTYWYEDGSWKDYYV